nr:hypothetical protein CFP56_70598 [Quercus suber]
MADFVELGAEATNHLTEKHFDKVYDKFSKRKSKSNGDQDNNQGDGTRSAVTNASGRRRHRNQLPSPERDPQYEDTRDPYQQNIVRDLSPERSETSERVLRAYEAERDDPRRKPETVFVSTSSRKDGRRNMSGYTGYPSGGASGYDQRPRSQPPRSRYDYDGDSDYDDREGRRYTRSGRGYRDDDDYEREVIETERYKGPARGYDARRLSSQGPRDDSYGPGAGAVTQYRRSGNDATTDVSRRTRDRGRDDRYYDDRDRSYSRSRSRSRSRSGEREEGIKGKIDEYFDTSAQGLGVGIAGAVVGGLAGRQFGKEHKRRDIILGAIVGGLGANAAENKFRDWKEEREERKDRYEQRYDGRARSSMR